jgi:hypothetical protein
MITTPEITYVSSQLKPRRGDFTAEIERFGKCELPKVPIAAENVTIYSTSTSFARREWR